MAMNDLGEGSIVVAGTVGGKRQPHWGLVALRCCEHDVVATVGGRGVAAVAERGWAAAVVGEKIVHPTPCRRPSERGDLHHSLWGSESRVFPVVVAAAIYDNKVH